MLFAEIFFGVNICDVPNDFGHIIESQLSSHQTAKNRFSYKMTGFCHSVFLVFSNIESYTKWWGQREVGKRTYHYFL